MFCFFLLIFLNFKISVVRLSENGTIKVLVQNVREVSFKRRTFDKQKQVNLVVTQIHKDLSPILIVIL